MASSIIASVITGGTNSHQTVAEELNTYATDFVSAGVVGTITTGPPMTGSFGITQDASPDMGITVLLGQAYVPCTPTGQDAQVLRARMTANYTAYTINANSSGSTKYDWIYLQANATNASTPDSAADNVINLYTSRSSLNTSDNGSPPTYGTLLGIVTVANGASSITNANITDKRSNATIGGAAGKVQATALANPYKFSVYVTGNQTVTASTFTKLTLNTKAYDTGTNFDATTNYRFTAPAAGFYQMQGAAQNNGNGAFAVALYKNGSLWKQGTNSTIASGVSAGTVSDCMQLATSDYVELWVYSGNTLIVAGQTLTYMSGFLVATT